MMKSRKKMKTKKAKIAKKKGKAKKARGIKLKHGGGGRAYQTRLVHEHDDDMILKERVRQSIQNYQEGRTKGIASVEEVWQFAESD
jgi:hypothetical protein